MSGKLKEVRERIKSVISTQQITKAMKMVSAAKLRRAQNAIVQMRPYSERLDLMLKNILQNLEGGADTVYGKERDTEKALLIVITSSRGLCGAFNTNIIKKVVKALDVTYARQRKEGNVSMLFIGKRGFDFFRKRYSDCKLISDYTEIVKDLSYDKVKEVGDLVLNMFATEQVDRIEVAYGRFKNAGVQFPEFVQYLPVPKLGSDDLPINSKKADYIFEPEKEDLLKELVPSILKSTLHKFILDTHASEHGARMTAMDKATENANDILRDLRINYNKARQEAITKELSEIVGGAAALEG